MNRRGLYGDRIKPFRALSTRVPEGVLDKLQKKAERNGTTVSEEARRALIFATGEYVV